ncbi:MAG: proline dehydrogenase family protein [Armatimonadetes bacterium]|nr:proline dehydrogenase family protein [Armatimonadota bacterium]
MSLARALILKTAALSPIERFVRKSFLFRPLVRRFIAGDTLDEAIRESENLIQSGLMVTLDNLGENTKTSDEAIQAKNTYIDILSRIAANPQRDQMNMSIKLTQCGFDLGDEFTEKNFREVLEVGAKSNTFVRVDMESSDYTERTIQMIERVFPDQPNTGTVLQSYLHRAIDDTERMIALGVRIRVVKGAYLEPPEVALPKKSDVDAQYVEMSKRLMKRGNYPAIATHDEAIINELKAFAKAENIDKSRFEFQMLFGIRRDLQKSLHDEGYNVRIYMPYGDQWYPYFTRRLAERPANSLFILKSLFKG